MNQDELWIKKCIDNPNKYKIYVDNDEVFVVEIIDDDENTVYSFSRFGYDFIVVLFRYLKCNVTYV